MFCYKSYSKDSSMFFEESVFALQIIYLSLYTSAKAPRARVHPGDKVQLSFNMHLFSLDTRPLCTISNWRTLADGVTW